jgi:hypothetical protein
VPTQPQPDTSGWEEGPWRAGSVWVISGCPSVGQNPSRQLYGLELDRVFTDTVSGKSAARPRLQAMLAYVRDGDTVIVHSMDRLARNLEALRRLVRELTGAGWPSSSSRSS